MAKFITIIVFLLSLAKIALAGETKFALIRRIQGIEQLPQSLSRQLEKLAFEVVYQRKDLELLLSGSDAPTETVVDMVAIESEVKRRDRYYQFETRLVDVKTKKVLTKASKVEIREEDLTRLYKAALESLFIPDGPLDDAGDGGGKKHTIPSGKSKSGDKPSTTHITPPDKKALDFKKRLRELQVGVDDEIVRTVDEKEKASMSDEVIAKTPSDTPPPYSSQQFVSANNDLLDETSIRESYPRQHTILLGYDSRNIETASLARTITSAQLLTVNAVGHVPLPVIRGRLAVSYEASYSRVMSSSYELAAPFQFGLYGSWLSSFYKVSLGAHQDSSFFVNLPTPGEGLKAQSISTTWIRVKSEINVPFYGEWKLWINYAVPLKAETDHTPAKFTKDWSGNSLQLAITPPLSFKKWESQLMVQRINLSSQGVIPFLLNESRLAFSLSRSI